MFQAQSIDFPTVVFIKELGRAFQNPIQLRGIKLDLGDKARAELIARVELESGTSGIYDVLKCPVCGCRSLVRIFDIVPECPDTEYDVKEWLHTVNVRCYCCSFEVTDELPNPGQVGLPIEDYWLKEELIRSNGI